MVMVRVWWWTWRGWGEAREAGGEGKSAGGVGGAPCDAAFLPSRAF